MRARKHIDTRRTTLPCWWVSADLREANSYWQSVTSRWMLPARERIAIVLSAASSMQQGFPARPPPVLVALCFPPLTYKGMNEVGARIGTTLW
jgi:hypothetical protein